MPTITAKGLWKIVCVLNPADVLGITIPSGSPRCPITVRVPDKNGTTYLADLNAKSVRKAQATLTAEGAENVSAIIQGRLDGAQIAEAGLVAAEEKARGRGAAARDAGTRAGGRLTRALACQRVSVHRNAFDRRRALASRLRARNTGGNVSMDELASIYRPILMDGIQRCNALTQAMLRPSSNARAQRHRTVAPMGRNAIARFRKLAVAGYRYRQS
jgi:hypothetical protein